MQSGIAQDFNFSVGSAIGAYSLCVWGACDAGFRHPCCLEYRCASCSDDNPFLGLKAAIDRLDHAGQPLALEQAVTPYEALYAYTIAGAILSGDEQNRGSIPPGKWADLAVLNTDPSLIDVYR